MIRSSLIVLGSVIALSLGFAPGMAEAAGDIQLECWDRTGQPIAITPSHQYCRMHTFVVSSCASSRRLKSDVGGEFRMS